MRILAVGLRIYLGDLYLNLMREGHEVRVYASDPASQRAFGGIITAVDDWRTQLPWVGYTGIILFEGVGQGWVQDNLRKDGYRVVGGSALGDRLELDRAFGQAVLAGAGMPIAQSHSFNRPIDALDWLERNPGAYVLKYDDNSHSTFVGEHPFGADVRFILRRYSEAGPVLLMQRLRGVEVGIGAYFDGTQFLLPACIDFEHKRFFPGDIGEMTGEMGTLASYEGADALFTATLSRVGPQLAEAGHVGYVNLNLIVNEGGAFPLEFTCRFGNPGFAVLAAMQVDGWGDLLSRMVAGGSGRIRTLSGWAVAIVLTIPPFPHTIDTIAEEDAPIFFHQTPDYAEQAFYHYVDMRLENNQLLGHRRSGHLMIVTGTGATVIAAQAAACLRATNVIVPELRWRNDIGARFMSEDAATLSHLGWL
jgi:phosphoribosylamine--glycine ligase